MEINFNFIHLIVLLGAAHGLLLAVLMLAVKRFRKLPNYFLALFLVAFSIENIATVLSDSNYILQHPELLYLPFSWNLVFGPSFYFYVRALLEENFKFTKKHFVLFLPFIGQLALNLYVFALSQEAKLEMATQDAMRNWYHFENFMILFYAGTFLVLTLRLLHAYRKKYEQLIALKQRALHWIEGIVGFLLLVFALWLVENVINYTVGQVEHFRVAYLLWGVMVAAIYWVGYNGYLYPEIFQNIEKEASPIVEKYHYSNINNKQAADILQKTQAAMLQQKLYQNPRLTLQELATQINTQPNNLSQVINDKLGKNFADFVNGYRIEEVKKKLLDKTFSHYTILAIGLECGFNSKSSFNTIFKKHTLQTPSQFRKKHLIPPKKVIK